MTHISDLSCERWQNLFARYRVQWQAAREGLGPISVLPTSRVVQKNIRKTFAEINKAKKCTFTLIGEIALLTDMVKQTIFYRGAVSNVVLIHLVCFAVFLSRLFHCR